MLMADVLHLLHEATKRKLSLRQIDAYVFPIAPVFLCTGIPIAWQVDSITGFAHFVIVHLLGLPGTLDVRAKFFF